MLCVKSYKLFLILRLSVLYYLLMKTRIAILCNTCIEEAKIKKDNNLSNQSSTFVQVEMNEEGVYTYKCPKGHKNWTFNQSHHFQVLFDLGILSLSDSYTREAVSRFRHWLYFVLFRCIQQPAFYRRNKKYRIQSVSVSARQFTPVAPTICRFIYVSIIP